MINEKFDKEEIIALSERYTNTGDKLYATGDIQKAIIFYRKSIELYPSANAYTKLGLAYSKLEDYDRAIEYCKTAIDIDSSFANPYNDIGAYLIVQKKYEEAEAYLNTALNGKNYNIPQYAWFNLAVIYYNTNRWVESMKYLSKCMEFDSNFERGKELYYRLLTLLN